MIPKCRDILVSAALVIVIVVSGCLGFDAASIAKNNSMIKDFLNEHPNAQVRVSHYSAQQAASVIEDIRRDCENPSINQKEFYGVKVTDPETNFYAVAWIDAETSKIECAFKIGTTGRVVDKPKTGTACESHSLSKCDSGHLYWFDSCGNRQERKEYCDNGCSGGTCISTPAVSTPTCTNECQQSGTKECTDSSHFKTCGNYDSDSCLEWSTVSACTQGQTCSNGQCGCDAKSCSQLNKQCGNWDNGCGSNIDCGICGGGYGCNSTGQCGCTDICTSNGSRQCMDSTHYRVCSINATDSCLKWGAAISCQQGQLCTSGQCITSCMPNCTGKCGGVSDGCGGTCNADCLEHCQELIAGHNQLSGNRINVVFIAGGTPSLNPTTTYDFRQLFIAMVQGFNSTATIYQDAEGLKGIEPYSSNIDKFNFWYIDVPLFGEDDPCRYMQIPTGATCQSDIYSQGGTSFNVNDVTFIYNYSPLKNYCSFQNKFVHIFYNPNDYVPSANGGWGGIIFNRSCLWFC